MIVLSLQSAGPCAFVSIVSASPSMLENIFGRGHQVGFCLQFYSSSSMHWFLKYAPCGISYLLPFSMMEANIWRLAGNCWEVKLWLFLISSWPLNSTVQSRRSQGTFEFVLRRLCKRVTVWQLPWPRRQPEISVALYCLCCRYCNTGNFILEPQLIYNHSTRCVLEQRYLTKCPLCSLNIQMLYTWKHQWT